MTAGVWQLYGNEKSRRRNNLILTSRSCIKSSLSQEYIKATNVRPIFYLLHSVFSRNVNTGCPFVFVKKLFSLEKSILDCDEDQFWLCKLIAGEPKKNLSAEKKT